MQKIKFIPFTGAFFFMSILFLLCVLLSRNRNRKRKRNEKQRMRKIGFQSLMSDRILQSRNHQIKEKKLLIGLVGILK
jgi:hypothetical protein